MQHLSYLFRLVPPLLALSFVTNLSILISPLFMMQVLDRVLPSGNHATLILLGGLAGAALLLQAVIEAARDKSLGRIARWVEKTGTEVTLQGPDAQLKINQIAQISQFLAGSSAVTLLNLPWLPLLGLVIFLLHPAFLVVLVALLATAFLIRWIGALITAPHEARAQQNAQHAQDYLTKAAQHHGGTAGTAQNLRGRFFAHQADKLAALDRAQSAKSLGDALTALLRGATQVIALGIGAYLVTQDALSAGGMIAASLLMGKTYGLTESAITQLPKIRSAAQDFMQLRAMEPGPTQSALDVGELPGALRVENLTIPRAPGAPPRLDRVSFTLDAGACLVIAGASGSGKTSLLKAMAALAPAPIGAVYLGESEVRSLPDQMRFQQIGYLAQQPPILPGSIAENISCFANTPCDEQIIEAAKITGIHGLISALPQAYDCDLETEPFALSNGQKQRLALARAVFNKPKYLFLDEPNAILDSEGERALYQTLCRLKEQGTTIVMVLHRSGLMTLADKVLRLENGRAVDFGDRNEVLGRMATGQRQITLPLLDSSTQDLCDWISAQFNRADDAEFSEKAQLVGSELFTALRRNGPKDMPRQVQMNFSFVDDQTCDLSLVEPQHTNAAETLSLVQDLGEKHRFALQNLPPEQQPFATLASLTETLEADCQDNTTMLQARVARHTLQPPKPMMKLA